MATIRLDGSSPCSLSRAGIWRTRKLRGCQLPDAILHGKRSCRPRSRAVQGLTATGFRVRLFSSLGLMVAPPACEPGKDTSVNPLASSPLSARSATAFGGAFARCHGSRLLPLRLLFVHRLAVTFYYRQQSGGFHGSCRDRVSSPVRALILSRLSASFAWLIPLKKTARAARPC